MSLMFRGIWVLGLCCAIMPTLIGSQPAFAQDGPALFRSGQFAAAETAWRAEATAAASPSDESLRGLATLALLSNRLVDAEKLLTRLHERHPDDKQINGQLAEVAYRQDQFERAAEFFRAADRPAMADKLASFAERKPYAISGEADVFEIAFERTDPLPLVSATLNGGEEVLLLIDTGGGELILDPEVAKKIGASSFGEEEGTFAGDKKSAVAHAAIDSITLGELTVENVPVKLLPTQRFSAVAGGKPVGGVLGTVFLYHFLATLDYPNGKLILRRPGSDAAERGKSARASAQRIPFWMASDHLILARGAVNGGEECLFFVDTGLAGAAFTCPKSTIEQAKIKLSGQSSQGVGGGGTVTITPFMTETLRLGDVERESLLGIAGAFPESLEYGQGFRIGGLISHAFFRPYAVTFDFEAMEILVEER